MNIPTRFPLRPDIVYPECDGKPRTDNTRQFEAITTIQGCLVEK